MDRNDIKNLLAKQFDEKMGAFLKKRADYASDLEKDLGHLRTMFGDEIVTAMVAQNGTTLAVIPPTTTAKAPAGTTTQASVAVEPAEGTKRRRRRSRKVRGGVGFSELKPIVVETVKGLSGKRFTIQDVKKALKSKKVKFEQKHLHLILPRYLSGIEVVDKQKRKGFPMNVYEVKGDVALVNYTVASKVATKK